MLTLIIGGLITWRLSHMFVKETGPLAAFSKLRADLAKRQKHMGGLFDLISCIACTSIYVGAMTAVGFSRDVFSWVVYTIVFSAIAMIIERFMKQTA